MNSVVKYLGALALTLTPTPTVSQILIQQPETVRNRFNNGVIVGSTAAFGTPVYGDMILGELVYARPSNISRPHCDDYELPTSEYPQIVIVERGGCQFADKVLNAQKHENTSAVIVVDNDEHRTPEDIRLIIMADDRWGKRDISIPSVLITKSEGDILIGEVEKGTRILVRLEWDLPNEHTVNLDMWTSPSIPDTTKFLQSFAPIARQFKFDLDFVPHFWIFSLTPSIMDMDMCTSKDAKYCAFDPDMNGPLKGRDAVYESVRQYCLWDRTHTKNHTDIHSGRYSDLYWRYVERLPYECPVKQSSTVKYLTDECSYALMGKLGVDVNGIKMCVANDFETILEHQKTSLAWSPSALMINNYRYSGPLQADLVTKAICTGYVTEPSVCRFETSSAPYPPHMSHDVADAHTDSQGFPWWGYLIITTTALLVTFVALVASRMVVFRLRRQLRYEVFEEVNNQLEKGSTKANSSSFKTGAHTPDTSRDEDNEFSDKNFVDVRIV